VYQHLTYDLGAQVHDVHTCATKIDDEIDAPYLVTGGNMVVNGSFQTGVMVVVCSTKHKY
jgi:hypothetical protein